jgi:hypothetical protein
LRTSLRIINCQTKMTNLAECERNFHVNW